MGRLKNRFLAKLFTRFPKLVIGAAKKAAPIKTEGVPWTPFTKELKSATIAIVTTAGVHLKTQKPFDMDDPEGDPTFRTLPSDTPKDGYAITHDYYDHTDADRDINIVFPINRLQEMKDAGVIGGVSLVNFGFMGHIDGPHIETLIKKTAPEAASLIKKAGVDAVLLTPG
ncbi:MAG: hypothetical protein HZB21_04640 [Deltaproteobacteria bacterium]|nr:hypothetical protein [Deltaproteobacteria bacterium]